MVVSSCKFPLNLDFKFHSIIIRMDDTTFRATWDDTGNFGVVNLTKAELKEFTTSTGSDKGKHITLILKKPPFSLVLCVLSVLGQEILMLMETDDLAFKLRLKFDICCMTTEESVAQTEEDPSLLYQRSMCRISV